MHDGSHITLKKIDRDYDPTDKAGALRLIRESNGKGEFLTGLFYVDPAKPDFTQLLDMHEIPLSELPRELLRPSREALTELMDSLR